MAGVDVRSIHNRRERLRKRFDSENTRDAMRSGIDGEVIDQQEQLSIMRKAQQELKLQKNKAQEAYQMREKRKLKAGER